MRLQHYSNAGIDQPNPGENFVQVRLVVPLNYEGRLIMLLQDSHAVLPPLSWSETNGTAAATSDLHDHDATADVRAYVRSFAASLVPLAALALACVVAACFTPLGGGS